MADKKRLIILISILLLLAWSLFYNQSSKPEYVPVSSRPSKSQTAAQDPLPLRKVLEKPPVQISEINRNIFEFDGESVSDAMNGSQSSEEGNGVLMEPVPPPPVIPEVRYLGFYMEKSDGGQKMAALSNSGRIWVGRVGEVVGGKYKILQIETSYAMIEMVSDSKVLKLPLGNKTGEFLTDDDEQQ